MTSFSIVEVRSSTLQWLLVRGQSTPLETASMSFLEQHYVGVFGVDEVGVYEVEPLERPSTSSEHK